MANDTEKQLSPPYLSWRTFSAYIKSLRQAIPPIIDKSAMSRLSGTNQRLTMNAFKYLRLVDDEGKPEESLETLIISTAPNKQSEYQENLKSVLRTGYPFLFDGTGAFDLAKSTPNQLSEKFRATGVTGETVRKCETFFLIAAEEAGLKISPHIKADRKRGRRKGATPAKPKGNKKNEHEKPKKDEGTTPNGEELDSLSDQFLSGKFGLLHKLQIEELPQNGVWNENQRQDYIAAYQAVLDLLVKIVDEDNIE